MISHLLWLHLANTLSKTGPLLPISQNNEPFVVAVHIIKHTAPTPPLHRVGREGGLSKYQSGMLILKGLETPFP